LCLNLVNVVLTNQGVHILGLLVHVKQLPCPQGIGQRIVQLAQVIEDLQERREREDTTYRSRAQLSED
jgi:hypothetical protein